MAKNKILDRLLTIIEPDGYKKSEKVITSANRTAEKIVEEAVHKAQTILKKATAFDTKLESTLKQELKGAVEKEIKVFQMAINQALQSSLAHFEELTEIELRSAQTILEKKINADYLIAKKEIEKYKKNKMEEIDASIQKRVEELSLKVLGQGIPPEVQEKLVLEALAKAKKYGYI